ncbi:MAG: methyl-accepting chemotaxis protein [Clostridiales bacterium]|nr:methyl-accepting chemotaxis protein [Clostridiales bacterium]
MLKKAHIESCKAMAEIISEMIPGGVLFGVVEDGTVGWLKQSESFKLDLFHIGYRVDPGALTMRAINENKVMVQNVPASVYGKRLRIAAIPFENDAGEACGSFTVIFPREHPVASSFDVFAPILAEMFHEGAVMYMTDLQKIVKRQASSKFDIDANPIGHVLGDSDLANETIRSGKPVEKEVDASKYGMPVLVTNHPLFDEENGKDVVGSFGIVLPKKTAVTLRDISSTLENGLSGISAAIEELAASAGEIHSTEKELNTSIGDIVRISEEIEEVSEFIKDIADETKMLGMNAAIEAARAGDAGRGFGVVADEIRKLSDQSKGTVPKIKKLTDNIKRKVEEVGGKSKNTLNATQEQAAATEEVTASVEEMTALSEELNKLALLM